MRKTELTKLLEIKYPLIVAPMAGGPSSVELVATASEKGALGFVGSAYSSADEIHDFAAKVRSKTSLPFGINLFIPEKLAEVSSEKIHLAIRETQIFRDELSLPRPELKLPYEDDFDLQFEAVLRARPKAFSFVFGLLENERIRELKQKNIIVIGTATSLDEGMQLVESGVDAIVVQGIEAGGHRGIFDSEAEDPEVQTLSLLQSLTAKTQIPLIAAGGVMCGKDIKKMLATGAQAVQMGTAFLCVKEAGTSAPYRKALLQPQRLTKTTRAFSGRLARGIVNRFMTEMDSKSESILPFPAQNKFTRDLRKASAIKGMTDFLSLWAGTGQGELWTGSTADLIDQLFSE